MKKKYSILATFLGLYLLFYPTNSFAAGFTVIKDSSEVKSQNEITVDVKKVDEAKNVFSTIPAKKEIKEEIKKDEVNSNPFLNIKNNNNSKDVFPSGSQIKNNPFPVKSGAEDASKNTSIPYNDNEISEDDWDKIIERNIKDNMGNSVDYDNPNFSFENQIKNVITSSQRNDMDVMVEFKPPTVWDSQFVMTPDGYLESDLDSGFEFDEIYAEDVDEDLETVLTIQYLVKNGEKYQKFIDTGIKVDEITKEIKSEDIMTVIKSISVSNKSPIVEDVDRVMILAEGEIVILKKSDMSLLDNIQAALNKTGIVIKAQNTRMGGKFNLPDYLEFKKSVTVVVNNSQIELTTEPIIENSQVLLPIKDISVALGANVNWNEKSQQATITKNGRTLIFTSNSNIVQGSSTVEISNPARVKNKRMLVPVNYILEQFGSKMYWDAKNLILVIEENN